MSIQRRKLEDNIQCKIVIEREARRRGQQGTASPQEAEERKEALKTQGRKGVKAVRINMAFTPSNHEFIKVMAKATGRTMTEFTNIVIEAYRKEHPEFMESANGFLQFINTGRFSAEEESGETGLVDYGTLKPGDAIECASADDAIQTMKELAEAGIETDFSFERDGEKGLWLKVL